MLKHRIIEMSIMQYATIKAAVDACSPSAQVLVSDMCSIIGDDAATDAEKSHAANVVVEALIGNNAKASRKHLCRESSNKTRTEPNQH